MVSMKLVTRIYDRFLAEHLAQNRQMALVSGPRQVGKTTTCRNHADSYANWDNTDDQTSILAGPAAVAEQLGLDQLRDKPPVAMFDELRKYTRWKQFLKGFYDSYADRVHVLVTGSSRLDTYRRVGDSLMGRYFLYHMHPFSVAEIVHRDLPNPTRIIRQPKKPKATDFDALWQHGGYPEPYLKRDPRFSRRWQTLRTQQLLREDLRDLTQVQQIDQISVLSRMLASRSGSQITFSNLAKDVQVSVDTLRRWVETLSSLHYGFLIRPWFKNITRSLRKEPKWFLRDWAEIEDEGSRAETFVGCHLLKAVDGWNDLGLGKFQLAYLRDKEKREVDFAVIRDEKPWFLVEVKHSETSLSPALRTYQEQIKAPFAFQVVIDFDYVDADCFATPQGPTVVPGQTFLSQLI